MPSCYQHSHHDARALSLLLVAFPLFAVQVSAQTSASLGNGLSAQAIARGGSNTLTTASPLDAMEGNPAGLAHLSGKVLELDAVGLTVGGSFSNAANAGSHPRGLGGALPYGAFARPLGHVPGRFVASVAVTPEILMRANWHYTDAPGTAGASYGYQTQETQIVAVRSALGLARSFGPHWSAGATLGIVYNQNDLHAPYIFQQQPALAGLKVQLALTTRGYGWNGGAGVQWQPNPRLRAALAWKSGTTLRTQGDATGTASAQFAALGLTQDPTFAYHAQVQNHLPQAAAGGLLLSTRHATYTVEGDITAWGQAFQQLPITLTGGTNPTINSVVGADRFDDVVPLHWSNQLGIHSGVEIPVRERVTLSTGYSFRSDPVPSATLTPLTAAILRHAVAAGAGYTQGRYRFEAAYQAQLPTTRTVQASSLQAGEYSNSSVRVYTQSLTLGLRTRF